MKYCLLIFLVFIGCEDRPSERSINRSGEVEEIYIDVDQAQPMRMSDYFSRISYVSLHAPNNSPMGIITKIMPQGDTIALYDRTKKSVWIYKEGGAFIGEVKIPEGRGPGELEHISDVYFDEDFRIHVLGAFKIMTLDMDGNLIAESSMDLFARYFTYDVTSNKYYGFANGNSNVRIPDEYKGYDLFKFDDTGVIEKSFIPIEKNKQGISYGIPNYFPKFKGEYYFFKHLHDTVYKIEGDVVQPAYALNFGDYALPDELFERRKDYGNEIWQWTDFWDNEIEPYDYIVYKTNFEITEKYIHMRVGNNDSKYMILYHKDKKETYVGEDRFINDIDFGPSPFIFMSSDKHLYSYVNANDFLRHMNSVYESNRERYSSNRMIELRRLANAMSENSNPVLMKLEFK